MSWTASERSDRLRTYRQHGFVVGLSQQAGNVLYWALGVDSPATPELVRESYSTRAALVRDLRREPNCGIGTAHEIATWAGYPEA